MSIQEYIENGLVSYGVDPADSDYQRGYEACLKEISKLIEDGTIEVDHF